MTLNDLYPLPGTRDYCEARWFSEGDKLLAHSDDPNREAFSAEIQANFAAGLSADPNDIPAFSGRKYDDYGGYGRCIKPESIFEVGVAAGYSIAAMLYGAGGTRMGVWLMDMNPDLEKTVAHIKQEWPDLPVRHWVVNTQTEPIPNMYFTGFDIVHIDGCHTYQGALNDLNNFGTLLSDRGLIVVDDAKDPNILRACDEFRDKYGMDSRFIDNHNGHYLMMRKR